MSEIFDYKSFLKTLTTEPGVYKMLDATNHVLYVGKARNLKKRVSNYFQKTHNARLASLVQQIADIQIMVTETENEALLLENNLIKQLKPRYNILFRDDKSYPYIFLSAHVDYPRLDFHRGARIAKGEYFGPYPSSGAVRQSLHLLQKLFQIRQCTDTFFKNRARPCIQYQIKRCTAPCVNRITPENYQANVRLAKFFLQGKNSEIIVELMRKMEEAALQQRYEQAAVYRDQINSLRQIQEQQHVIAGHGDNDIIAAVKQMDRICVHVLFIRGGRMIGNHNFFTRAPMLLSDEEVLHEFIPQFYLNPKHKKDIPGQVIVNTKLTSARMLENMLGNLRGSKVTLRKPRHGHKAQWIDMAEKNARTALAAHLAGKSSLLKRLEILQQALGLDNLPQRIECFDISHSMGEATVAACVVFTQEGPDKQQYRRFNITHITRGDDYAALHQALLRRYQRLKETGKDMPDIILIDGGRGQLHQAEKVMEELQISGVVLLSIAKGPGRKAGLESIYKSGSVQPLHVEPDSPGFHVLQQIRDEAHRFAITGHKNRREKQRKTSQLETIPGIGVKRRKQLLHFFGGLQALRTASITQLCQAPGISPALAKKVYAYFHEAG